MPYGIWEYTMPRSKKQLRAANITPRPYNPDRDGRRQDHDYNAPGTYLVTIKTRERLPFFGQVMGVPKPYIKLSPLGEKVRNIALPKMHKVYSMAELWRFVIMPDHIHMIIRITDFLPDNKKLGHVINSLKNGITAIYHELVASSGSIWKEDFNDQILRHPNQLAAWKKYISDNPRRLWERRSRPDLFRVVSDMTIAGHACTMIGNRYLLDYPEKGMVICHRRYTDVEWDKIAEGLLTLGANGGVLVGTGIAERERELMNVAYTRGYKIIRLILEPMGQYYKPHGKLFDRCVDGTYLEISFAPSVGASLPIADGKRIAREQCLALNAIAEAIATDPAGTT